MRESDTEAFVAMLADVWALTGKTPTPGQTAMFVRALASYPIEAVRAAFDAHVKDPQRGRFAPLPADLIAQLQGAAAHDNRPGPEEAWAIALAAQDERATVVWTAEMAAAWNIARPVFAIGDEVGARMAFRESYTRLVTQAREHREPVRWQVSLGWDGELRQQAIDAAVMRGHLSPADAQHALPAPAAAPPVSLLELVGGIAQRSRQSLRGVADELRGMSDPIAVDTSERDALAQRKAQVQAEVDAFVAQQDTQA